MSDDWDQVTKIGKNVRSGGGGPREGVVRGNAAINAARRTGAVLGTEKKFVTGNKVGSSDGQKAARVDRETDVGKLDYVSKDIAKVISDGRNEKAKTLGKTSYTREDFARDTGIDKGLIAKWETSTKSYVPNQQQWNRMESVLNLKLRGKDIGKPKFEKKK